MATSMTSTPRLAARSRSTETLTSGLPHDGVGVDVDGAGHLAQLLQHGLRVAGELLQSGPVIVYCTAACEPPPAICAVSDTSMRRFFGIFGTMSFRTRAMMTYWSSLRSLGSTRATKMFARLRVTC